MLQSMLTQCLLSSAELNWLGPDFAFNLVASVFPLWGLYTLVWPWFRRQPVPVPVRSAR